MTELQFAKMEGLGNDFLVIDAIANPHVALTSSQVRKLADRRLGVGADQVLLLARGDGQEVNYRIWNADGNEVAQCGNGARAAHVLLRMRGHVAKSSRLRTRADLIVVTSGESGPRALLGEPSFEPGQIPLARPAKARRYEFDACGVKTDFAALSIGNPHAVFWVDNVEAAQVAQVGRHLNESGDFPEGVNVGFATVPRDGRISLRVHERGVGETPACGSGAAACAVVSFLEHGLPLITVRMPGGELNAGWDGPGNAAWIEGAVNHVFNGTFSID